MHPAREFHAAPDFMQRLAERYGVSYCKSSAGLQHAKRFAQHFVLIGGEILIGHLWP
ncbi:MAG TPA: hypothetical protein VN517_17525 [Terriglobales bacterium]|nr:hypothetical protein [Terriglobales bacterium]